MPTVKELRLTCKQKGIKGYSKWKKAQLIQMCSETTSRKQKNKRLFAKQFLYTKGIKKNDTGHWYIPHEVTKEELYNFAKSQKDIQRGDVVRPAGQYRNLNTYVWDGKHLVELDSQLDEYGNLPLAFSYPEFDLTYWDKNPPRNKYDRYDSLIRHNDFRWIDKQSDLGRLIKEQIQNNKYGMVTLGGVKFGVVQERKFGVTRESAEDYQ